MPVVCRHPRANPDPTCAHCRLRVAARDKPKAEPPHKEICTPTNEIVIDHGAGGLGDALQGAMVSAWLKANTGKRIVYRAGKEAHRDPMAFVRLFADVADEFGDNAVIHSEKPVPGAIQMNVGYKLEDLAYKEGIRSTLWDLPRWERYMRNVGARGFIVPDLREPERLKKLGAAFRDYVALFPFSTDTARCWSLQHWLTLESALIKSGYKTAIFHHERKGTERFRGVKLIGQQPERVVAAMLNCAVAIGTDHGLSHLAGILKRPTIVLGGWFPVRQIYGCYPAFVGLQGVLECDSCCNGGPIQPTSPTCRPTCANLNSITPERVIDEGLTRAFAGGDSRTLIDWRRLRTIRDCVTETNHFHGDLAELGVYRGGSAKLILQASRAGMLRLFDTFHGIPEDDQHGKHRRGDFADTSLDSVRAFLDSPRVEYFPGFFPATAPDDSRRYRFVHLDGDTYQTTRAALDYFVDRMTPGGRIVFDDVDWENCPGVRRALEEFFPTWRIMQTPGSFQAQVRF